MKDLFIDLETLGRRPGCAIIELAAVIFDPATGETAYDFHRLIQPGVNDWCDLDTLSWHERRGSFPHQESAGIVPADAALEDFRDWLKFMAAEGHGIGTFWSWGAAFDFPILEDAYLRHGWHRAPWNYWQVADARTIWNLAFPGIKRPTREHRALADCHAGITDLCAALAKLAGKEVPA